MVLNERNETLNTSFHWASERIHMPYSMRRSPEEWMKLVLECRKSGMSDRQWCNTNNISYYTFASAIKNLRRMNYEIPKSKDLDIHDLTLPKQDVVKVDIVSDVQPPIPCGYDIFNIVEVINRGQNVSEKEKQKKPHIVS